MALVDVAQRLLDPIKTIGRRRLVVARPVDVNTAHINIGITIDDPIRDTPPDSRTGQNTNGVQARRDEVPLYLGRFSYEWCEIRCERLRPAK